MAVEITWPRAHDSKSLPRSIVAFGLADESVVGVVGECRLTSESAERVHCTLVSYLLTDCDAKAPRQYRWSIFMKVPGPGEYIFAVTGLRADGKTAPESATVRFKVEQPSTLSMARLGLTNILYPATNQDITLEASNLTANGDLFDYPLEVLEFKDSSGNVIDPVDTYEDCVYMQLWMATYPPLAPGVYSLYVKDTSGSDQLATGIYVGTSLRVG